MRSSQRSVGIGSSLWNELDGWLKTDNAKNKGFYSKAQFANFAVGDYLTQCKNQKFTHIEILQQVQDAYHLLLKQFERQTAHMEKLEIFWMEKSFPNINSQIRK